MVDLSGISKEYDREVLRIDRLILRKGLIYGIIGPSGAGKSTLLRIINLLTPPSTGSYQFMGRSMIGASGQERLTVQRHMALVFQRTLLFRDSVWNNVAYGLRARGYDRNTVNRRVSQLLEQLGMKDLASRRADTLSGGEAQRVAIARAMVFEPQLLLLDEPTANLDPGNVALIEDMICAMSRAKSITVVIVTHNVFQARRIADEVVFIEGGRIIEIGPAKNMFTSPEQEQTRLYVEGRMVY